MGKRGATLIELMVVLVIIAMMLGLLLPAVHYSRELARTAVCQSNLRQLAVAMKHFIDVHKKLPDPAKDGTIGGWAIAILPFMEDTNLADGLSGNPALDPLSPLPLARTRPGIMSCPSAYEGDSTIATVPVSHYSALLVRTGRQRMLWRIGEVPDTSRIPWVTSPETPFWEQSTGGPHGGHYQLIDGIGARAWGVRFAGLD